MSQNLKTRSAEVIETAKNFLHNFLHSIPPEHLTIERIDSYIAKAYELADAWHATLGTPVDPGKSN